jgi:hypothetical protein
MPDPVQEVKMFLVGVGEAVPLVHKGGRILAITYAQRSRTGVRLNKRASIKYQDFLPSLLVVPINRLIDQTTTRHS